MKPNPLLIISIVFAASFSGRAISLASAATHALDSKSDKTASAEKPADKAAHAPADAGKHEGEGDHAASEPHDAKPAPAQEANSAIAMDSTLSEPEQISLLAALRDRSAQLDAREAELAERARTLEVIENRIDEKTNALADYKKELESRLSFAETAAAKDISQLARMYETMKPARAGEIFNAMDPSFAAGFLTEMNSENAALILSSMDTEKAYAASVIIAGRNAAVRAR